MPNSTRAGNSSLVFSRVTRINADPAAWNDMSAGQNTQVGYDDVALPGSLPILNKEAVLLAVKAAIALGCSVNLKSSFDRKHYLYKDLPAGYQITQQHCTLCGNQTNLDRSSGCGRQGNCLTK
jgi:Asp-tRNA(Asn)/Glu-tRNA(Gln) amidotransferase B subunit